MLKLLPEGRQSGKKEVLDKRRTGAFVSLAALILLLAATVGCGKKTEEKSGEQAKTTTKTEETQTEKDKDKSEGKTYGLNEKAELKAGDISGELTVAKVTVTNDLASPEANALLLTGPNDYAGANPSKSPASGKEFLMITFLLNNTGTKQ